MNRTPTGLPAGFMKVGIRVKNGLKLQKENVEKYDLKGNHIWQKRKSMQ